MEMTNVIRQKAKRKTEETTLAERASDGNNNVMIKREGVSKDMYPIPLLRQGFLFYVPDSLSLSFFRYPCDHE